jgi:hypothetical protein
MRVLARFGGLSSGAMFVANIDPKARLGRSKGGEQD